MNQTNTRITWVAILIILVGIAAVAVFGMEAPALPPALPTKAPTDTPTIAVQTADSGTVEPLLGTPTPDPVLGLSEEEKTPVPAIILPTLTLPDVPIPSGGTVYTMTPTSAGAVGWVRADDDITNHLGDYNIYAGIFDGFEYVGAIQFDLSAIPPGTPILHADLTLLGLSAEHLGTDGVWTVELLQPWLDPTWDKSNFPWLQRPDSQASSLAPDLTSADLATGRYNTVFFSPEGIQQLQDRTFAGIVSFRVVGPTGEQDNLFSWDAGVGSGSLGVKPMLRIIAGPTPETPPPSPTPAYVIVTPVNVIELAAQRLTATAEATPYDGPETPTPTPSATPLPPNWVTPIIVAPPATPENYATAEWRSLLATSQAIVYGTPTATPPNVWTATPTPPAPSTPYLVPFSALTPTPTATVTPGAIPGILKGKILFLSDRTGANTVMVMDGDGRNPAILSDAWAYQQAKQNENLAPDGRFRALVQSEQLPIAQVFVVSTADGSRRQLTHMNAISYDPAWSPRGGPILFVSPDPGNDEIYAINPDGSGLQRLTFNDWEWDKHPTWSPDGSQIVFWSNRLDGRRQIWIMNADGTAPRNLSNNAFNDWDPVWVK